MTRRPWRRFGAAAVPLALDLFTLASCRVAAPNDEAKDEGPNGELFKEQAEVLWDVGNFGFSSTGERLEADRIYLADLDADGSDELVIYTSYLYLNQPDPSPVLVFDVRDGGLVNVSDELFPDGPASAVVNRDMHFADLNGDGHLDLFLSNHGTEAFTRSPANKTGSTCRMALATGSTPPPPTSPTSWTSPTGAPWEISTATGSPRFTS